MKSKTVLIAMLFLFCLSGGLRAQTERKPYETGRMYIGLKGGAHLKVIANQNNYGQIEMAYDPAIGLMAGVYLQYSIGPSSSISIEGLYQQQGQNYSDTFRKSRYEKTISLNYLAFPIVYRYYFNVSSTPYEAASTFHKPKWYVAGGIQPAILTSAGATWAIDGQATDFISFITEGGNPNQGQIEQNGVPESTADLFNDFDIVVVVGAGMQQELQNNIRWFAELRGGVGMLDMNAKEWRLPNPEGVYQASRNAFVGLQIGLAFSLF